MKTTTAEQDPQAAARLQQLIEDIAIAMITTVAPEGALRSRPMVTLRVADERELWFLTRDDSQKADDLDAEQAVNVSYADLQQDRYVSVTGQATLVRDRARIDELWKPSMERYFPAGRDDAHLALLRVRIASADYWDPASRRMQQLKPGAKTPPLNGPSGDEQTHVEVRAVRATG